MKTQQKSLAFARHSVVELNNNELLEINGGTTTLCAAGAILASAFVLGVVEGIANEINDDDPNEVAQQCPAA